MTKILSRLFVFIMVMAICVFNIHAHPLQNGIVFEPVNNRLGDESVGWIGLLGLHSPTNQFIYDVYIDASQVSKFEDSGIMGGDLDGLIDAADDAAYRWNSTGVVTFQKYVDGTNQTGLFGSITAYDFRELDFVMPEDKTA